MGKTVKMRIYDHAPEGARAFHMDAAPAHGAADTAEEAPYGTYSKGQYRVVKEGDTIRVELWGATTKSWSTLVEREASLFTVSEDPVNFYVNAINMHQGKAYPANYVPASA